MSDYTHDKVNWHFEVFLLVRLRFTLRVEGTKTDTALYQKPYSNIQIHSRTHSSDDIVIK